MTVSLFDVKDIKVEVSDLMLPKHLIDKHLADRNIFNTAAATSLHDIRKLMKSSYENFEGHRVLYHGRCSGA